MISADIVDEARQGRGHILEGLVLNEVNFLDFERLHEAFALGIVK